MLAAMPTQGRGHGTRASPLLRAVRHFWTAFQAVLAALHRLPVGRLDDFEDDGRLPAARRAFRTRSEGRFGFLVRPVLLCTCGHLAPAYGWSRVEDGASANSGGVCKMCAKPTRPAVNRPW